MKWQGPVCVKCKLPLVEGKDHEDMVCLEQQVKNGRAELQSWKDEVYELRNRLGWLWWNHPAILSDQALEQYRKARRMADGRPEIFIYPKYNLL